MQLTNLEKWRHYFKSQTTPEPYIDMSFYYMINAALQRRVWTGSIEKPLFPNMYVILVGEPSIGKGFPINTVTHCLSHHKYKVIDPVRDDLYIQQQKIQEGMSQDSISERKVPNKPYIQNLFTTAPDSSTFEGIVNFHAESGRALNVKELLADRMTEEEVKEVLHTYGELLTGGFYIHSSVHFALEEISSLFRKHTEDLINYLIKAFDGNKYDYRPKTKAVRDFVVRPCLNFLGATQPSFISRSFADELLNEGFTARIIFVYAQEKRFEKYDTFTFTEDQLRCKREIIEHLGRLGTLFGNVKMDPDALEYYRWYFEEETPKLRSSRNPKLAHYYGRKNILATKLAVAVHFADNLDLKLSLAECQKSLEILEDLEKSMHLALNFKGANPFDEVARAIRDWLRRSGPKTREEILENFYSQVKGDELDKLLEDQLILQKIKKIKKDGGVAYKLN